MLIPFGDWTPDQPDLEAGVTEAKNVLPQLHGYRKFPSLTQVTTVLPDRPRGAVSATDKDGNVYTFAGTTSAISRLQSASWVDVSISGGYATGNEERWAFTKFGERVIAANYSDPIQSIIMGAATFGDLASAAPQARYVTTVGNFLVVANTFDVISGNVPHRVWWPAIGDPTNWPEPGTSAAIVVQSDYQDLPGNYGWINAIVGGEYGVIFQERAITRMTYVGSPNFFQFDVVESERGTPSSGSVVALGRFIFYLGQDGFYLFDGLQSQNIGKEKVDKTFYTDLDQSYFHTISAVIDPINSIVIWAYPGAGSTSGRPNKLILYNWVVKKWAWVEVTCWLLMQSLTSGYSLEQLDSFSSSVDGLTVSLDARAWTGGALQLSAFLSNYALGDFNGTPMSAMLATKELQINHKRAFLNALRPLFVNGTVSAQVGHRNNLNSALTWTGSASPNDSGIVPTRVNNRYMRFRMTTTGDFDHALGFEIDEADVNVESER